MRESPSHPTAREGRALARGLRCASAIKALIAQAIDLEKSGARVKMKTVDQFEVPAEFSRRLQEDPRLAGAFRTLTPGRQKGYLPHFGGAKQPATRAARVDRHISRILKGLGLDD